VVDRDHPIVRANLLRTEHAHRGVHQQFHHWGYPKVGLPKGRPTQSHAAKIAAAPRAPKSGAANSQPLEREIHLLARGDRPVLRSSRSSRGRGRRSTSR
jgi:hypothetical protein